MAILNDLKPVRDGIVKGTVLVHIAPDRKVEPLVDWFTSQGFRIENPEHIRGAITVE